MAERPTYDELLQKVRDLEESLQTYQNLVHNSPDLLYRTDMEGRITYTSPSVFRLSGYTAEEAVSMSIAEDVYLFPEERKRFLSMLQERGRVKSFEARLKRKDGSIWWASTNAHFYRDRDGTILGVEGITRDISERKAAEKALRESGEKYRHLFETAMVGIYRTRIEDGAFLEANLTLARMMGFESVERFRREYVTSDHYSDPQRRDELLKQLRTHGRVDGFEIEMIRADGSTIFIALSATLYPDQGFLEGVIVDISDRVRAEAALRESEERFRTLVEESPLGFSLISVEGRYKYVNPRFREIFGYTIEDVPTGRAWFEKAFPDEAYRRSAVASWQEDLRKAGVGRYRPHAYTVTCGDGARKEILFRSVTMENMDQIVIYEDITERSKMERQLRQTQKFEAIATLAGGVAHDFNNLLMGIQGRASLMAMALGASHTQREHIEAIEEYVLSAASLTRQLLGFARGGKYETDLVDMNDLVLASAAMFGRTRKEIRIHSRPSEAPLVVEADRPQIEQVLLNLYVNAWQAMPNGGNLYLETSSAFLDEADGEDRQVAPGRYVRVSVTDTGIGMDEATRQRIFDPFFTTKEKERGTGLGLASAYGIIKNHGGMITVTSEPGHGATFDIYLPASKEKVPSETAPKEVAVCGTETILLVDDEEMIIEVGRAMLEKLGYRVLVADGGEQALKVMEREGDGIDLVILDLIMPGMDGGTAFDRMRDIRPNLPVLLSSGYALDSQAKGIMHRGAGGFIQKPFSLSALSRKVRAILGSAADPVHMGRS